MQLLVIEKGKRRLVPTEQLLPGKQGNLQTLSYLLPMIRRDAFDVELRKFVLALVADCDNSFVSQVGRLFEYAQSIRYVRDPIDGERIADAFTTIDEQAGDCGDLTILLASMLGTIGYLTRVLALNFFDDLETHGYDHLLPQVQDDAGEWQSLDATPEALQKIGWEPEAPVRTVFEIWPTSETGVGGLLDDLIGQGIQLGTQYAAGAVQQARLSSAQAHEAGARFDNLAGQVTQLFTQIQSLPVITADDLQVAVAAYQQLAQMAQQFSSVDYVTQQWNSEDYKPAYEARLQQMATMVQRGGSQTTEGAQTVAQQLLPASVAGAFSNPLAWVAVGIIGIAVLKKVSDA